ncbi:MAG: hypothetical protein MZW92_23240 [Comamonadaceae bacterium]|nr:hypothetical protein [Comamonadaceae bacterium]
MARWPNGRASALAVRPRRARAPLSLRDDDRPETRGPDARTWQGLFGAPALSTAEQLALSSIARMRTVPAGASVFDRRDGGQRAGADAERRRRARLPRCRRRLPHRAPGPRPGVAGPELGVAAREPRDGRAGDDRSGRRRAAARRGARRSSSVTPRSAGTSSPASPAKCRRCR